MGYAAQLMCSYRHLTASGMHFVVMRNGDYVLTAEGAPAVVDDLESAIKLREEQDIPANIFSVTASPIGNTGKIINNGEDITRFLISSGGAEPFCNLPGIIPISKDEPVYVGRNGTGYSGFYAVDSVKIDNGARDVKIQEVRLKKLDENPPAGKYLFLA
ncbi:hypothetical protein J4401_01160 [Candidatus Woesearchaeota archaeon]|nr:hypothetical protein [Candidatus Woesearchaeota archaeon]